MHFLLSFRFVTDAEHVDVNLYVNRIVLQMLRIHRVCMCVSRLHGRDTFL